MTTGEAFVLGFILPGLLWIAAMVVIGWQMERSVRKGKRRNGR